jgi:hypothetical protein
MYHLSNLERMINESEETLRQKRGEMAYLNRECRKLRQRITATRITCILSHKQSLIPIHTTQIVPYDKE